ncbi:DNA polymerase III subunit alpha [Priestia filamentosa]|uniref:DNA polymerase III subunit alpha n=1 Tax=Priestia filamentosa TaxID=1402861 RepID=UPI00397AAE0E
MSILNVKSESNLNSIVNVKECFKYAKEKGYTYAAVTNDGNMFDLFSISEASKSSGLKAVLGCKLPFRIGNDVVELALYPRSNKALTLLNKLSTKYHKNEKKNLSLEGMKQTLKEMAIVIDSQLITPKNVKEVIKTLTTFLEKNILYVGIHENFEQEHKGKNLEIKDILTAESIKYIPFNEIRFLSDNDFDIMDNFSKAKLNEEQFDIENSLLSQSEINELFSYMEGTEDATNNLISQVKANFIMQPKQTEVPVYDVPKDFELPEVFKKYFSEFIQASSEEEVRSAGYLCSEVFKGLRKRYEINEHSLKHNALIQKIVERAISELKLFINMNFSDYTLIVWDFMKFAREKGIKTGPGRGSVTVSLVAYCLEITEVDPIEYDLPLERFLHKDRTGMPDIDIDIEDERRGEVIAYLRKKYGDSHVAHILTTVTTGFARASERMLKVMRVPSETLREISSYSPGKYNSLKELIENEPEIENLLKKSKDAQVFLRNCYTLKDIPDAVSTHAAGVILSNTSLEEGEMPMMYDKNGHLITQLKNDKKSSSLEKQGKLKMDMLGLRNLTVLNKAENGVLKNHNVDLKNMEIPLDDAKTLKLINDTKYLGGIFQLESKLAQDIIKEVGVKSFKDVYLVNALNRPGPNKFASVYAKREGKPTRIFNESGEELTGVESLYPVLNETRGIIVYQEQIMKLAVVWAGYSFGEADTFRRAISNKDVKALNNEERIFVEKSIQNGRDEETTRELFKIILKFANYGFNKGHAIAYSKLTFQLAYIKAHYPLEFWSALLTTVANKTEKVAEYINEARKMGIPILPPHINLSSDEFLIEGNAIRCAFQMVNDIGKKTAKGIVDTRGNVPFKNVYDVLNRIKDVPNVSKGNLKVLAKVGTLDALNKRNIVLKTLDSNYSNEKELTIGEKVIMEIENCMTVFSIEKEYRKKLEEAVGVKENYIAGIIQDIQNKQDKYRRDMARIKIVSIDGEQYHPVIFSKLWAETKNDLYKGAVVLAEINKGKDGTLYYGNIKKIKTVEL